MRYTLEMSHDSHAGHHKHHHGHHHAPGHAHDRGWQGFFRYASNFRRMWTSEVSAAVVGLVAPKPGERVLEIGSGMGAAVAVAARTGATIVATDPTAYMRRILRLRRLALAGGKHVRISTGAAEALPAADASIDAVFTVNTMHHWTDPDRALAEIRRVLRPGGRVLLVDEDFDDPAHPEHAHVQQRRARHHHHFESISPAVFAEKLRALGFTAVTGEIATVAGRPAKVVRGVRG